MELKYILILIGFAVFLLCFIIHIVLTARRRKREVIVLENMKRMYADKNLAKMDYDFAVYDAELEKIIASKQLPSGQLTIDDVMPGESAASYDNVFQTFDNEGMEEITGSYIPD